MGKVEALHKDNCLLIENAVIALKYVIVFLPAPLVASSGHAHFISPWSSRAFAQQGTQNCFLSHAPFSFYSVIHVSNFCFWAISMF